MNPEVDTSFLPDRDRDAEELAERERLRQEWAKEQQRIKGLLC
jgi:protein FAM50